MSSIKRVFLTFSACFILLFSFVFPSYAAPESDYIFEFNIDEPYFDEYSGYLVQPFYRLGYDVAYAKCYFWVLTPVNVSSDSIPAVVYNFDLSSNEATLTVGTGNQFDSWYFSLWVCQNNTSRLVNLASEIINYNNSFSYTILASSNANSQYRYLYPTFKGVSDTGTLPDNSKTYQVLFSSDSLFYGQFLSIHEDFTSMLLKQDYTNEQLDSIVSYFSDLIETCFNINSSLDEFVYYYWDQFAVNDFPAGINAITSRLDKIYKLLSEFDWGEITTGFNQEIGSEFNEVEENINNNLNNPELDNFFNGVQIDTSTGPFAFIWNLITSCFNSHPEVTGLVATILTFGLIALILNR